MTDIFRITQSKILAFLLAFILLFAMVALAQAQESPDEVAKKYNVAFPIGELGGCTDYASCRTYCEDPVNSQSCIGFAKAKGFYKEDDLQTKKDVILDKAKAALGCDSLSSCLNFCEVPANYDKCHNFAQGSNLSGGILIKPDGGQILAKAQQVLGCSSENACKSFCEDESNREKCAQFARETGLRGGEHKVGPGGCTSESTCKSLCSDPNNYQVCSGFSQVSGNTFTGPGGCNSEESCRTYCQQNEQECSKGFGGPRGNQIGQNKYNPAEMCNKTPNCAWQGNTCQCGFYGETNETREKAGEYAAFCQSNPDKCKGGQQGVFENVKQRQEFESYCSQNPEKCKPPTSGTETSGGDDGRYRYGADPATECARYGCTWAGGSCQCSTTSGSNYNPPSSGTYTPSSGGDSRYPSYSGSGSYTPPSSGSYTPPSSGSYTPPSSGSYTPPPSGTYTQPASGTYTPPSSGSYTPPSQPSEPAPQQPSQPTQESAPSQPSTESAPPPSYTPPSGVQGVSTARGLLQAILDWLRQ
ncbi:hypothetical protein HYS96_03185 [Candidatus Daviesbacteria bacterium]|nr:hypothetical protein [Candidatus Daviesbacteria bacterium]